MLPILIPSPASGGEVRVRGVHSTPSLLHTRDRAGGVGKVRASKSPVKRISAHLLRSISSTPAPSFRDAVSAADSHITGFRWTRNSPFGQQARTRPDFDGSLYAAK